MNALRKTGFETVFARRSDECGEIRQIQNLGALVSVQDNVYNFYHKPYYDVLEKPSGAGSVYVALFIGGHDGETAIQQTVLETRKLETDLVTVDVDSLSRALEETGKALIYGIYFDTDEAVVKPESEPARGAGASSAVDL